MAWILAQKRKKFFHRHLVISVFLVYYEKRLKRYFTKSEIFFSQATPKLPEDKIF